MQGECGCIDSGRLITVSRHFRKVTNNLWFFQPPGSTVYSSHHLFALTSLKSPSVAAVQANSRLAYLFLFQLLTVPFWYLRKVYSPTLCVPNLHATTGSRLLVLFLRKYLNSHLLRDQLCFCHLLKFEQRVSL